MKDWVKNFINHLEDKHNDFIEKIGCERCGKTNAFKYEFHHIMFKSNYGWHDEINNPRNLLYLCKKCHQWYHEKKDRRQHLIKERNLDKLFNL